MSTPNAIEVPGPLLEAIQQFLASDDTDAILRGDGPLTNWDRTQLELSRKSWQRKLQQANGMIRAIEARLADSGQPLAGQRRRSPLADALTQRPTATRARPGGCLAG